MKKLAKMSIVFVGCMSLAAGRNARSQAADQLTDQDKQFLMTASQSDYNEITFSQLAVQKSKNPQVEAYAAQMITDHQKLEQQMKPFADMAGITPATTLDAAHQQKFDQLSALSGSEFNKMYMADMDVDHHASLDSFKLEEQNATNSKLKSTVANGRRVVAQHTEMADTLTKKLGQPAAS